MEEKAKEKNYFEVLNNINVQDKVEKKNGLSYLSWAWAWGEIKKKYPNATYVIYERETTVGPVNYFTDGKTCWVKTGVIVNDIEHIEELPVMDYKNKSILLENITSFDVNKAIQRSLTKALARHGLGLYIYAGEDLPEEEQKELDEENNKPVTKEQMEEIIKLVGETKIPDMLTYYKLDKFESMTNAIAKDVIARKTKKAWRYFVKNKWIQTLMLVV